MLVFKLSWLPYMLCLAGLVFLFDGSNLGFGLFLIGVGVVWIITQTNNKNKTKNSNTTTPPQTPVTPPPINKPSQIHCSQCGNVILARDAQFCNKCGAKLNR